MEKSTYLPPTVVNPNYAGPIPGAGIPVQSPGVPGTPRRGWAARAVMGLSITQVVLGTIAIICQAFLIGYRSNLGHTSTGFVCGILFIVTGAFGIAAAKRGTSCLIVTLMVLCIISASSTSILVSFPSVGLVVDTAYSHTYTHCYFAVPSTAPETIVDDKTTTSLPSTTTFTSRHDNSQNVTRVSMPKFSHSTTTTATTTTSLHHSTTMFKLLTESRGYVCERRSDSNSLIRLLISMHAVLIGIALLELVVAIVAAGLTCRTMCCYSQTRQVMIAVPVAQPGPSSDLQGAVGPAPESYPMSQLNRESPPPYYPPEDDEALPLTDDVTQPHSKTTEALRSYV